MRTQTELGRQGEEQTAQYLQKNGYTILARNYLQRTGEIDVIACSDTMLLFVEVKLRTASHFDMAEVITRSKQKKIITTAKIYLAQHDHDEKTCRFDVALINTATRTFHYLKDAFRDE
ncbi:MAG TPA: YraN family protein [Candidatus Babeliales bacterium]|nr:YraN family protein [Candidatus Babeliales bacterium]